MRRTTLAAALLGLAATAARGQEPVLLRISGTPGQTSHYRMVMEQFVRGGPMAAMMSSDTTLPMMRITSYTTRTLTGTSGDTLNFQETIDSAQAESPAMPQMAAMMGGAVAQMRGQVTATKMDGRGRVFATEVTTPGGAGMGAGGSGGPGGGMGRGRGGMLGGRRSNTFVLPAQAVRPGDTWNDSSTIAPSTPDEPNTTTRGAFKLERIEQRAGSSIAIVTWTGTMTQAGPMGAQTLNVVGQMDVDLTAKRLASMSMTMSGMVQMQGSDVPIKIQMAQSVI